MTNPTTPAKADPGARVMTQSGGANTMRYEMSDGPIRDAQISERTTVIAKRIVELDLMIDNCPDCGGYGFVSWITGFEGTEHVERCGECDKRAEERAYLVHVANQLEATVLDPPAPTRTPDEQEE